LKRILIASDSYLEAAICKHTHGRDRLSLWSKKSDSRC